MSSFPSVLASINDLTLRQINGLLELAREFKNYAQDWQGVPTPFLHKPIVATSFLEHSTRTKHSFAIAIKRLDATYLDFNAETSSLKKGETLDETLLTLKAQGVDLCIIRTSVSNAFDKYRENPPIKIINGGDGTNQHPTQALLDLFTMIDIGMELTGKTITIVGDCMHSRVGHSLIDLLPQFGVKIILCGPKAFIPQDLNNPNVTITDDLDEAISESDLIYLLRIQKERHCSELINFKSYITDYGLSVEKLVKANKQIPVFHPGPANIGVEITEELIHSKYYFGYEQVKNSIFIRMAILQAILTNSDKKIGKEIRERKLSNL